MQPPDDPLASIASDYVERREPAEKVALAAIEGVLKEHGLLDALDAEEQAAIATPPQRQLLVLAA